jgi:hypothetical protein
MATRRCPFERARFDVNAFESHDGFVIHMNTDPLHEAVQGRLMKTEENAGETKYSLLLDPPIADIAAEAAP